MISEVQLLVKSNAKNRDIYPANGIVLCLELFFENNQMTKEKSKEKTKRTINVIVGNAAATAIKNNASRSLL